MIETLPLITTKLYRPPVRPDIVPRPRLLAQLDAHWRERPMTLISAPAGFGKTMLASTWLESVDCANAWVSLDERDDDLHTFVAYLVAAVAQAFPDAELGTRELLNAPSLNAPPTLAQCLVQDLDRIGEPLILALDDIHLVGNQAVFDFIVELLRHPLPGLHVLLVARLDPPLPIASWRARGQIFEIRTRDLRFSAAETGQLIYRMLRSEVDQATAAAWTERTEGWVTALYLAALSLQHNGAVDLLNANAHGESYYLQEYLLGEVLSDLPSARSADLIRISILDRFCAPLYDALCQPDGSDQLDTRAGSEFMQWLRASNLFLTPLDSQNTWFRFHHLFQQVLQQWLRERVAPQEIATLHDRAGRWLEQNGLWDEALRHYVATGEPSAAIEFVIRHRYELLNSEQMHRLHLWIQLLPPERVQQSAYLMGMQVTLAVLMHSPHITDVRATIRSAMQALSALPPNSEERRIVQAEIAVTAGVLELVSGESTTALSSVQDALDSLPAAARVSRVIAYAIAGASRQMQGQYDLGIDQMRRALAEPAMPPNLRARLLHHLCEVCFMEGDLSTVIAFGHSAFRLADQAKIPGVIAHARHDLGVAYYLRNEFELAEPHLRALIDDRARAHHTELLFGACALALLHMANGQVAAAVEVLRLTGEQFSALNDTFATNTLAAAWVELALQKGDLAEARRLSIGVDFEPSPPGWFFFVPQLTQIKLMLAERTAVSLAQARARLEALDERMAAINRKTVRIDVLCLLALVCDAQGDEPAACRALLAALTLAEPGGFVRNFADHGLPMLNLLDRLLRQKNDGALQKQPHISRILDAFRVEKPTRSTANGAAHHASGRLPVSAVVDRLTGREAEVLQLLGRQLAPTKIADQLCISIATVRSHMKNIYRKLGVHSRHEAVISAREQGLI